MVQLDTFTMEYLYGHSFTIKLDHKPWVHLLGRQRHSSNSFSTSAGLTKYILLHESSLCNLHTAVTETELIYQQVENKALAVAYRPVRD